MLQGIRAPTLTGPPFGHSMSLTGVQKMEGYNDVDPWAWAHQPSTLAPYPAVLDHPMYSPTPSTPGTPHSTHHSRHPTMQNSRSITSAPATGFQAPSSPPVRQSAAVKAIKAQPAFRPTWHGYLDTTKDAMTIVEAALQGRLSHISRRPHDKERAQMLTSGTVLVYEENASGIKRWTDAVHWSPSRVMNNCLIYRQLIRALKPEEKRSTLNPSCGSKRKRKESSNSALPSGDEYEHSSMETSGDSTPLEPYGGKAYTNFAQTLTPEQQRRFCGSLIDSYEFKEGGLMKKTISVKYQGTHHHIISYYSLEDVVSGKLKRPFQDPKLADIKPRPELLTGWKVSLEDEESKDTPIFSSYPHRLPRPNALPPHSLGAPHPDSLVAPPPGHAHSPLHAPHEYWHGHPVQYASAPQAPTSYPSTQGPTSPYAHPTSQEYPAQQTPAAHYHPQHTIAHPYSHPSSPQHYSHRPSISEYSAPAAHTQQYQPQQPPTPGPASYPVQPQQTQAPTFQERGSPQQWPEQATSAPYAEAREAPIVSVAPSTQFTVPQASTFDISVPVQNIPTTAVEQPAQSEAEQQESQRRTSAPLAIPPYGQPQMQPSYQTGIQSEPYYVGEAKFSTAEYSYQ